ncbi:MAG: type II toxin-antitoxin system VapC family toxin [Parvularculaceae bacterium]
MLVIDPSAVIAMLFGELEGDACATTMGAAPHRLVSAVNYVETGTVLAGRIGEKERGKAIADLDAFLKTFRIEIAAADEDLARAALKARIRWGKGFGLKRGLNFGDSFAYALAKLHGAPLLFVGKDFTSTDIESALP